MLNAHATRSILVSCGQFFDRKYFGDIQLKASHSLRRLPAQAIPSLRETFF